MPATRSQTSGTNRRQQPTASTPRSNAQSRVQSRRPPRGRGKERALPSTAFGAPLLPRTRTPPLPINHSPPQNRSTTPSTESSRSSSRSRSISRSIYREQGVGSMSPRPWTPIRWRSASPALPSFPLQTSPPEARFYVARYGTPQDFSYYPGSRTETESNSGLEKEGTRRLDEVEVDSLISGWTDVNPDPVQGSSTGENTISEGVEDASIGGKPLGAQSPPMIVLGVTRNVASTPIPPTPTVAAPTPRPSPPTLIQKFISQLSPQTQTALLNADPNVNGTVQFTERDLDTVRQFLGRLSQEQPKEILRAVRGEGSMGGVVPHSTIAAGSQAAGPSARHAQTFAFGQPGPSVPSRYGLPRDYDQVSNAQDRQTWREIAGKPAWHLARPS